MRKEIVKRIIQRVTAVVLATATVAVMSGSSVVPASQVLADELMPGYVRSVYTNEWVPAEQADRYTCKG